MKRIVVYFVSGEFEEERTRPINEFTPSNRELQTAVAQASRTAGTWMCALNGADRPFVHMTCARLDAVIGS